MPTYIEKTTVSDLAPNWSANPTTFDRLISAGLGPDINIDISLAGDETQDGSWITPDNIPNSVSWEDGGTQTVEIEMDVSNMQITARCRIVRLSPTGTILQGGVFTNSQNLQTDRIFSPVSPTWTDSEEDRSNRLAIHFEFFNTKSSSNSCSIGVATVANEIITDILENTAPNNFFVLRFF